VPVAIPRCYRRIVTHEVRDHPFVEGDETPWAAILPDFLRRFAAGSSALVMRWRDAYRVALPTTSFDA
jgi:hypothetical protein